MRQMPTVLAYTIDTTSNGLIGESARDADPQAVRGDGRLFDDRFARRLLPRAGPGNRYVRHRNERESSTSSRSRPPAVATFNGKPLDIASMPKFDEGGGSNVVLLLPPDLEHIQDLDGIDTPNVAFVGRGIISFSDAYDESPKDLRPFAQGALIYVGSTAAASFDFSTTARGTLPGLFVNARLADQMMRGDYLHVAPAVARHRARLRPAAASRAWLHVHAHDRLRSSRRS